MYTTKPTKKQIVAMIPATYSSPIANNNKNEVGTKRRVKNLRDEELKMIAKAMAWRIPKARMTAKVRKKLPKVNTALM